MRCDRQVVSIADRNKFHRASGASEVKQDGRKVVHLHRGREMASGTEREVQRERGFGLTYILDLVGASSGAQ